MPRLMPDLSSFLDRFVDDELRARVDAMGIRVNAFGYDRWGASPREIARSLALIRWLYRSYFRVEVHGLEQVPAGRVLLIGHHSAQLAYDGMLVTAALALDAEPPRHVRAMIERYFANVPLVGTLMTRMGQLTGTPKNASRLLSEEDAAVLVFPEGARGGGRVWRDRYKVLGFGQGFLRMALEAKAPIVPFGFIGGEEMAASFSRMEPLAKLFGMPYLPLSPTVVPLPLPTKVRIWFGAPMYFDGSPDDEDDVIRAKVGQVEQAVQALIDRGLAERTAVFS